MGNVFFTIAKHVWADPGVTSADAPVAATRRAQMSANGPRLSDMTRADGPRLSDATGAGGPGSASSATATR